MTKTSHHKIALYIRVSTEEQAKNPEGSIRSQEQRLRQFIEFKNNEENFGEVVSVFVDKAKSGKNTKRPELQRLLRMIRRREVTMVMVTELSRLSRSIRDFSDIWEMMKEHGCAFLCLREQFDTTTAAGEMVLYTVANISQFERKQVSERVKANFLARAKRGLFNGGSVPYGLRVDPDKSGHLKIQQDEAEIVQIAFKTYLNEGRLVQAAKVLNDKGYRLSKRRQGGGDRTRLGYFTIDNLQGMLKNKAYAGLRVYKENGEEKIAKAVWPAIVDDDLFDRVQAQLAKNHKEAVKLTTTGRRYPFLLANVIKCGTCGDRLPGKSAHGNAGKIPYYEHGWSVKRQATLNKKVFDCQPHRIQAKIVEPLVWDEIEKLLSQDYFAKALLEKTQDIHKSQGNVSQADGFRSKIRGIEEQLDALAEHLSKIPKGISPAPIYSQMQKMEAIKKELQNDLDQILCSEDFVDEPVALRDYQRFLKVLGQRLRLMATPAEKAKIVKALIHKIEVFPDRVKINYKVGENFVGLKAKDLPNNDQNARQTPDARKLAGGDGEKDTKKAAPVLTEAANDFFWLGGSKRLTNGRGNKVKGQFVSSTPYVVDKVIIIEPLKSLTKSFLHQKFIEERLSSKRIAEEVGCSATTVKKYLKEFGLKKGQGSGRHWNKLAYGEKIQKGRVVVHKSEQQLLDSIKQMYVDEGLTVTAIARILTSMKVPTKKQGKKWDHSVVADILTRAGIYQPKRGRV